MGGPAAKLGGKAEHVITPQMDGLGGHQVGGEDHRRAGQTIARRLGRPLQLADDPALDILQIGHARAHVLILEMAEALLVLFHYLQKDPVGVQLLLADAAQGLPANLRVVKDELVNLKYLGAALPEPLLGLFADQGQLPLGALDRLGEQLHLGLDLRLRHLAGPDILQAAAKGERRTDSDALGHCQSLDPDLL